MADLRVFFQGLTPIVDFPYYYFSRSKGRVLVCTDYNSAKNGVEGLMSKKELGLKGYQWQWHHVVETNHLKPLYDPLRLAIITNEFAPCALVSIEEHTYFSTNFHAGESPWVAFDIAKPTHSNLQGGARRTYVNRLRAMYDAVYTGREMEQLKVIANNVLDFSMDTF